MSLRDLLKQTLRHFKKWFKNWFKTWLKSGLPGHPVVSLINSDPANISKYADYHLQPIVKQIPSYVKDTNNFIYKINSVKFVPKTAT